MQEKINIFKKSLKKEIQIVLTLFFLPKIRKQLHVKPELEIKLFL